MGNDSVLKQLRSLVSDYYNGGNILDTPNNSYKYSTVDMDGEEIIKDVIYLLMNTYYVGEVTKLYLSNPYTTYEGITVLYNKNKTKPIKTSSVRKMVWCDKEKFITDFGEDFIVNLLNGRDIDIEQYKLKLTDLLLSNSQSKLLNGVDLNLDNKDNIFNDTVSDEDFEEFLRLIRPYIKKNKRRAQESLDINVIAYINYIVSHQSLMDIDKERLERLSKEINDF